MIVSSRLVRRCLAGSVSRTVPHALIARDPEGLKMILTSCLLLFLEG